MKSFKPAEFKRHLQRVLRTCRKEIHIQTWDLWAAQFEYQTHPGMFAYFDNKYWRAQHIEWQREYIKRLESK